MALTFGICTTFDDPARLKEVILSIQNLQIPNVDIILAGSYHAKEFPHFKDVRYAITSGWITTKKNMIARMANTEVIVLLHDYYVFDPAWYQAYETFGYNWDICSNPQYLMNGKRHFTDWVVWDSPIYPRYYSLDYGDWSQTKYQYISGGYFLVKRQLLTDNPFNEMLQPGDPEDVEWSLRVRTKASIVCNPRAIVRHNKIHRDCK